MKSIITLLTLGFVTICGHAMGVGLELVSASRDADAIIHCKIVDIGPSTHPKYSKVAKAEVVDAAKGLKKGDVALLLFDNGYGCPNVFYVMGEEVLVFAKQTSPGVYETLNLYCGRFTVQDGVVKSFDLFSAFPPRSEDLPVGEVLERVRSAIPRTESKPHQVSTPVVAADKQLASQALRR